MIKLKTLSVLTLFCLPTTTFAGGPFTLARLFFAQHMLGNRPLRQPLITDVATRFPTLSGSPADLRTRGYHTTTDPLAPLGIVRFLHKGGYFELYRVEQYGTYTATEKQFNCILKSQNSEKVGLQMIRSDGKQYQAMCITIQDGTKIKIIAPYTPVAPNPGPGGCAGC